ncbi:integrator complex assembly factor WDR73 [Gadus morhua]|uniref:WD repeat-containing protein 73 n=1 Tax=Gadus morhua TaxID=8049 RepID=A0A8C5F4V5_GADMO|nr:WD repeat-containing protein 73 [Gadus morhua]
MDIWDVKDDEFDDWLIESLKTYKDLYVYQLDHPTRVLEWTSGKTICVAGFGPDRNEILELHLPPKLFADENKGLCAERDFKVVHGGFSDGPVHRLRHIQGTRCVVTNNGRSSSLQVWDVGDDESDVFRRTSSIEGAAPLAGQAAGERGSQVAAGPSPQPCVLHGALLGHVQLSQLASGDTCYTLETDSSEPLSALQFVSPWVFLACCRNGNLFAVDTRSPSLPPPTPVPPPPEASTDPVHWGMHATAGADVAGCRVARLSSGAEVVVSDLRNPGGPARRALLEVPADGSAGDHLRVSWAPALEDCLAVSGFDGGVQVFSVSTWGPEAREQRALFQHRGHSVLPSERSAPVRTTAHAWHPDRPRTLLSAATDGSVHVWDWVHPGAAQD